MIDYGIKSVIYAYRDPNPIVAANNTPRILIEHGVDVLHYPLSVIDDFYRSYRHWTLTKKPWVTIKMAQTMDGKIAGPQGERIHLSNSLCSEFTHKNRLHSDVILTTARTIDRDDPELNVRLPSLLAEKDVALICGQSMLNHKAKIFNTARHCHLFHDEYASGLSGLQNSTCHAIPATEGLLDLEAVMSVLGQLGYHDVWVEAGGRLFSALHLARLVHRTHLYLAPLVLGPSAVSAYHHSDVFHSPCHVSWQAMGDNMIATLDWVVDPLLEQVCLQG
jgi:diaminohydroxyphosphoribosylaminopyrimidine deaminase/5-amino-6-(5-phosphoribosylamino)uracil reductase